MNPTTVYFLCIGIIALAFIFASLAILLALLRRPVKSKSDTRHQSVVSYCEKQLFKYQDLEEATEGFGKGRKLFDGSSGTVHSGVLGNGSHIAVQKIQCENEQILTMVLSRVELLSQISHRNLACLLGCCMDSGCTALVVYEFYVNGTLEEHLHGGNLDWHQRLNIAAETASVLAYLQHEISPPIYHYDLKSTCIFLDKDFSAKICCFGFGLSSSGIEDGIHRQYSSNGMSISRSDVYDLGVLLLEIISGSKHVDLLTIALPKIRSGKLEEIVDPHLYYHEQPAFLREQIEIVADLATRCLLFGGDGRIGMMDAARELVQIAKGTLDCGSRRGPALEETFSNSSLLQMMSMSPDSIHLP